MVLDGKGELFVAHFADQFMGRGSGNQPSFQHTQGGKYSTPFCDRPQIRAENPFTIVLNRLRGIFPHFLCGSGKTSILIPSRGSRRHARASPSAFRARDPQAQLRHQGNVNPQEMVAWLDRPRANGFDVRNPRNSTEQSGPPSITYAR
jgi:hypothetical protein